MCRICKVNQKFPLIISTVAFALCVVFSSGFSRDVDAQPDETMVPFPKRFAPIRSLVKKRPEDKGKFRKQKEKGEKVYRSEQDSGVREFKPEPFGRTEKKRISFPDKPSLTNRGRRGNRDRSRAPAAEEPDFTAYPEDSVPEYLVGHEDVLEISVWKNNELSKSVTVRPDGMISLPLIGDVLAAGRTPDELRQVITQRLQEYQENVVVSVIVVQVNSYRIYVLGEVVKPGVLALKRKTTLLQAIALAGGFNQFASKNKIMIIRERRTLSGREEKLLVRFDDIINTEDSKSNLFLRTGDTIFVP